MPNLIASTNGYALSVSVICALLGATACGPKRPPADAQDARPAPEPRTHPIWWTPDLKLAAVAAIPEELARPLEDPLEMANSAGATESMRTCGDYARLRPLGYESTDPTAFGSMKHTGGRCQALVILKRGKPSTDGRLSTLLAAGDLLNKLPAALAVALSPDELEKRDGATRAGLRWSAYDGAARLGEQGPTKAVVQSDGTTTKLELFATGDFNGDRAQDALIKSLSYGTEGDWFDLRLLLVGPKGSDGQLELLEELPL